MQYKLMDNLRQLYDLQEFGDDARKYEIVTPSHRFTNVVTTSTSERWLILFTARDHFNAGLAKSAVAFVHRWERMLLNVAKPLVKVSEFEGAECSFNAICAVSPQAHDAFAAQDRVLHDATFVVFPCYDCEFSGAESADEVIIMRKEMVPTLDWLRLPHPKLKMAYENLKTGGRSSNREPLLTSTSVLYREVRNLRDSEGGWIKVENVHELKARITWRDGGFAIAVGELQQPQQLTMSELSEIREWLQRFLCPAPDLNGSHAED